MLTLVPGQTKATSDAVAKQSRAAWTSGGTTMIVYEPTSSHASMLRFPVFQSWIETRMLALH